MIRRSRLRGRMEAHLAHPSARYGGALPRGSRLLRSLLLLGALILHPSNAWAESTLAAAIWNQYRTPPVIPLVALQPDAAVAPLPGAAVRGLSRGTLDGVSTYDLSAATVCALPDFDYPKFRGTQGFRQTFAAGAPASKTELRLLFAFDDEALAAIRSYEVTVSSARFLTIPYDQLLAVQARTRDLERCSGADPAAFKTVLKPIIADVDFRFQLARPFAEETVRQLGSKFVVDPRDAERLEYKVSARHRLIALGIAE
jgi:hypothetical protein